MENESKKINVYITKKQDTENMQIILQHGFITFVRRYCNRDFGTTELFKETIHEYFFSKKEIPIQNFSDLSRSKSDLALYAIEGIFCPTKDIVRLQAGFMDKSEIANVSYDVIKKEEIILAVKLFRLMLMKIDIPLYLCYEKGDFPNRTMNSSEIFLYEETFYELLMNNFEKTMNGAYIKYVELDLQNAMNIFFKQFNKEDSEYLGYRQNEDIDLFFKLFIEKEVENILKIFPNDSDWNMKEEEDCKVSLYIQRTYHIRQTKVNKYVLPMLADVRARNN
jgi:hypothetical protein